MNKIRSSLSSSIYTTSQFIINTISLVFLYYIVLTMLGRLQLGQWSMITAIPTALSIFGSGVSGCILRKTPVYHVESNASEFSKMFATGFIFNLSSGICLVIISYYFSEIFLKFILTDKNVSQFSKLFELAIWNVLLKYISSVCSSALDGMQKFRERSLINIASTVLPLIIAIPLIQYYGLLGIFVIQLLQTIIIFFLSLFYILNSPLFILSQCFPTKYYLNHFLIKGKDFQFISLSILFFEPVSKYFIKRYFNYDIVSLYDISMRATSQLFNILSAGIQVITPKITQLETLNTLDIKSFFLKTIRLTILVSSVVFTFLSMIFVNGSKLINISNFELFSFFIVCLSLAYLIHSISIVPYSILLGIGKTKIILLSHLALTVLNSLFYVLLVNGRSNYLVILPPVTAIIGSSFLTLSYCFYRFKVSMKEIRKELILLFFYVVFNISFLLIQNILTEIISQMAEICFFIILLFITFRNKVLSEVISRVFVRG